MFSHRQVRYAAVLLFAHSPIAYATGPAELYELPLPQACLTQLGVMGILVQARDQGVSSEQAQASLRKVRPDLEVSKELVANVFDYPDLGMNALERYTLWSCHARAHKIQPLPLKAFAADMRDCYANSLPQECAIAFQNRITGLPPDYRPRSRLAMAVGVQAKPASAAAVTASQASIAQDDGTRVAATRLANSLHLEKHWPIIIQKASADGFENVKRGAIARIESISGLSDAQRARAKEVIEKWAPQIAADVDALHRRMDVKALSIDMIGTVYTKYFTGSELQRLAEFYESSAFQKIAGHYVSSSKGSLEVLLTPQERTVLMNFYQSPLGQKQQNPQIGRDSLAYLHSRVSVLLDALIAPYQERLLKDLQAYQLKGS